MYRICTVRLANCKLDWRLVSPAVPLLCRTIKSGAELAWRAYSSDSRAQAEAASEGGGASARRKRAGRDSQRGEWGKLTGKLAAEMLHACIRLQQLPRAMKIFRLMAAAGSTPTAGECSSLIEANAARGMGVQASVWLVVCA